MTFPFSFGVGCIAFSFKGETRLNCIRYIIAVIDIGLLSNNDNANDIIITVNKIVIRTMITLMITVKAIITLMHFPFSFEEGWMAFSFKGKLAWTTFEYIIVIINMITIIFSLSLLLASWRFYAFRKYLWDDYSGESFLNSAPS